MIEAPEFYNPLEEVIESANLLEKGILPQAGGWLDQDEFWVRDVRLYRRIEARVLWERAQALKADGDKDPLAALFGEEQDGAVDWDAFTRG